MSPTEQFLVFQISDLRLAMPAGLVNEVARAVAIEDCPGLPPVIEGLIRYRGDTIPLFDLRARLGLPAADMKLDDHLLVVRAGARTAALRVDRAEGLRELGEQDRTEAESLSPELRDLAGVAAGPDGIVLLVDPERFLSDAEERSLSRALARREEEE